MLGHNDPRAETFLVLRMNVFKQLRENNRNCFAITSATPGAGKTFISVNLAIAVAMEENQSVMLVEADLRRPNFGNYLGLDVNSGLSITWRGLSV